MQPAVLCQLHKIALSVVPVICSPLGRTNMVVALGSGMYSPNSSNSEASSISNVLVSGYNGSRTLSLMGSKS
eukprot:2936027-Rhodomonas_salina.1